MILFAVIVFMPAVQQKKTGGEFFTRLVSPDELLSLKPVVPVMPDVKPIPEAQPKPLISQGVTEKPGVTNGKGRIFDDEGTPEKGTVEKEDNEKGSSTPIPSPPVTPQSVPSLREKLFDRNIIGDIAKRDVKRLDQEKKYKELTFNVKEYRFLIYNRKLKERIESIWRYPPEAAARGRYGDLVIKFSIKKNGGLGEVELVRTSGHKDLDDAAMKALRDGEPYWPLPEEWGMETYTIVGHFIYTIYGYYIR